MKKKPVLLRLAPEAAAWVKSRAVKSNGKTPGNVFVERLILNDKRKLQKRQQKSA